MAMVDRYKKSGGFVQLLQVIETCAPKKKEQFMTIITNETPAWAEAINQKMLTYDKILNWRPEALMEVTANVNPIVFVTSLKSLTPEKYKELCTRLSPMEMRKIDKQYNEITPTPGEISSCVMKVVSETRNLFVTNALKYDKIDPDLIIPDEFENALDQASKNGGSVTSIGAAPTAEVHPPNVAAALAAVPSGPPVIPTDHEGMRRKVIELTNQVTTLKRENIVMRDKLDKIKKIA